MYGSHVHLAGDDAEKPLPVFSNVKKLIGKALARIFKSPKPGVDPDLWQVTYQALDAGIQDGFAASGIKYNLPDPKLTKQLRESAAMFAAQKTWSQATALAELAASKPGYQISWAEFLEKARPIVGDYNVRWLKTEYNTAIRKARVAYRWPEFERMVDIYPNLKYTPSRAATPRQEHKPFYGIIRPVNDAFWIKNTPPSAFGCVCGVEQTDELATQLPWELPPPEENGLEGNPALTGQLFSSNHPYAKAAPDVSREALDLKQQHDYKALAENEAFARAIEKAKGMQADYPDLHLMEIAAIRAYTEQEYWDVNRYKRGERRKNTYLAALSDTLSAALNKLPDWAGISYRKTDINKFERAKYVVGQEVTHPYYTSTTQSPDGAGFSGNTNYSIRVKTGKDVRVLSNFPDEEEILLNAGMRFRVVSVSENNGETDIELEEL